MGNKFNKNINDNADEVSQELDLPPEFMESNDKSSWLFDWLEKMREKEYEEMKRRGEESDRRRKERMENFTDEEVAKMIDFPFDAFGFEIPENFKKAREARDAAKAQAQENASS